MAVDVEDALRNLSVEQCAAAEVLLAGGSIAEAAKAAKRSERTIHYWLKTVAFDAVMTDTRHAILRRARLKLATMVDRACDVIDEGLGPFQVERKGKRKIVPLAVRRLFARDVFELLGAKLDTGDAFDPTKLEEVLRAHGWVKRDEVQGESH